MLKVLLPITLPTAMSRSPRIAAMIEVATSGIDVPAAMMVRPITRSLTPRARAKATAESTSQSEPSTSSPRPATISSTCTAQWLSQAPLTRHAARVLVTDLLGLGARLAHQEDDVGDQQHEQQRGLHAAQLAVDDHHRQDHRGADHDRHLLADDLRVHDQRRDHGADAEDEQHVEDVAAHDVADCDVGAAAQRGADGHGHLRRTGAHRDDREADDQRRDAERQRDLRGAAHQRLGSEHQRAEAEDEEDDVCEHDQPLAASCSRWYRRAAIHHTSATSAARRRG